MGKNRKDIRAKQQASAASASKSSAIDIPEDEQWRIIEQTGILKQAGTSGSKVPAEGDDEEDYEISPLADEIFRALYLAIPMSFMLLLMEILVHNQYGRHATFDALRDRMLSGMPIIFVFVFYSELHQRTDTPATSCLLSNRYKTDKRMQAAFFWLSCIAGTRLIWLMNRGNWLVVMRQCPPIATAWIYAVVQLNLAPAVLSLVVAATFTWYKGYKLNI
ncbi:uncharacterized protein TRAVEDRAFT_117733 [Trametes versicolor FP-101664 SS1]|uniref:uncharacterized protein n=1 Tax=Trametes versicolor (strain FP-101664) TaxID=717944 RepID=UPI0004621E38|nr:uncharacterized protein TRAVEDRAFT_117733 [Trametes versicolor FP-101664 SS1]EIW61746.1 hypothetical protein TRAVEDRAFT_117733 [Trametes versicolor FP-101664 SS1]